MAFMSLKDIDVSYDKKKQILKGLNLDVEKGELVSLLGPSGCGKSTTLRVVAGFIDPQGGSFLLDGEDMTKVPVHKRNFGLVFQSYALFPHLSVYDNVAFGLRTRKMDKELIDKKVKASFHFPSARMRRAICPDAYIRQAGILYHMLGPVNSIIFDQSYTAGFNPDTFRIVHKV